MSAESVVLVLMCAIHSCIPCLLLISLIIIYLSKFSGHLRCMFPVNSQGLALNIMSLKNTTLNRRKCSRRHFLLHLNQRESFRGVGHTQVSTTHVSTFEKLCCDSWCLWGLTLLERHSWRKSILLRSLLRASAAPLPLSQMLSGVLRSDSYFFPSVFW